MLRIRITLTWIRILLFTLMRIRIRVMLVIFLRIRIWILPFTFIRDPDLDPSFQIKAQNLEKSAQIGSYSIHFGLLSASWCGFGFYHFDEDPDRAHRFDADPTFRFDADPDPQHWLRSSKTQRFMYILPFTFSLMDSDWNPDLVFFMKKQPC